MDRLSALRNVEDALAAFEAGECDLAELSIRAWQRRSNARNMEVLEDTTHYGRAEQ